MNFNRDKIKKRQGKNARAEVMERRKKTEANLDKTK